MSSVISDDVSIVRTRDTCIIATKYIIRIIADYVLVLNEFQSKISYIFTINKTAESQIYFINLPARSVVNIPFGTNAVLC